MSQGRENNEEEGPAVGQGERIMRRRGLQWVRGERIMRRRS